MTDFEVDCRVRRLVLLTVLFACGSNEQSQPEPARAVPTPAETPAPAPVPPAPVPPAPAEAEPATGTELVGEIRARVERGTKTFALVEHDLIEAAMALPESVADAFEDDIGGCLMGDNQIRCIAGITPHIGFLAETAADHGSSWKVVVIENGRVTNERSLVALSLHDPNDTSMRSLAERQMDGDEPLELVVEVPVRPLADDILFRWATEEYGAVTYVLDERLEVQARWTSTFVENEQMDEGDSIPRSESCSRLEDLEDDGSLVIESSCSDQDGETTESRARCPWDSATDRHRCPSGFADELFSEWARSRPHYVAENEAELRRRLPGLGGRSTR